MIYDILIIGGGPAGLTAGIYGARGMKNTLILEKQNVGGQIIITQEIENYPAFFGDVTGAGLMKKWEEHALHAGAKIEFGEVSSIEDENGEENNYKIVKTTDGNVYKAKSVILALGAVPRVLGIPGEKEFRGLGVSYCATCDAGFFRNLEVVMVGNGNSAIEEAIYLTQFASKVTILVRHGEGGLSCSKVLAERAYNNDKIVFSWNTDIQEVYGESLVDGVRCKNMKNGEIFDIPCSGVFFFVGNVPQTEFLKGVVDMDKNGYILVNDKMETSHDGIFSAGDANKKFLRQVVTAAGDGAVAAIAAEKYTDEFDIWQDEILSSDKPVIMSFCNVKEEEGMGLCNTLDAFYEENKDKFKLVKKEVPYNEPLARKLGLSEFPSLVVIKNGEVIARKSGCICGESLEELL